MLPANRAGSMRSSPWDSQTGSAARGCALTFTLGHSIAASRSDSLGGDAQTECDEQHPKSLVQPPGDRGVAAQHSRNAIRPPDDHAVRRQRHQAYRHAK